MKTIIHSAIQLFEKVYGDSPDKCFQSPGRVNLIGDYCDCHDGLAICCAVDFHTVIALKLRQDDLFNVVFDASAIKGHKLKAGTLYQWQAGQEGAVIEDAESLNYLKGITSVMLQSGLYLSGLDMAIVSNIPNNAGLGSTAALQTAFGSALNLCSSQPVSPLAIAQLAQRGESLYLQHTCGMISQMACVEALAQNALMIDSLDLDCQPIPLPDNLSILIVKPDTVLIKTEARRHKRLQHCQALACYFGLSSLRYLDFEQLDTARGTIDDKAFRQVRHLLHENQRAHLMVNAIRRKDMACISELMNASHRSLVDDYSIDNLQACKICHLIQQIIGTSGGVRITSDQSIVALLPSTHCHKIIEELTQAFPEVSVYQCSSERAAGEIPFERQP